MEVGKADACLQLNPELGWPLRLDVLSFSSDGLLLVSTGEGSRISLWQLPKGTLKWSVTTSQPVSRIAFSNEGKDVIEVLADGSIQRFSVP